MTQALIIMILVYRLIPARIRAFWSMGTSSSHLALAALRTGEPVGITLARYAVPRLDSGWHDNRPVPRGSLDHRPMPVRGWTL